jgi:hypothetical protein
MDFSHTKRVSFVKDENYRRLILAIQSEEIRKMKEHVYVEVNGNMTGKLTDMKQIADVFGINYHTLYNHCKGRIKKKQFRVWSSACSWIGNRRRNRETSCMDGGKRVPLELAKSFPDRN